MLRRRSPGAGHPPVGLDGPRVRAVDLLVGYGAPVCPPVDLELDAGEAVVVVGANGTGKSTLLSSVLGLTPTLGGRLEVLSREVDERAAHFRRSVSSSTGQDAFFPALTVREHLLLTAYGHGATHPEQVVDPLVEDFGLAGRAEALPSALSSGQRRRLLLAAALARPRVLLVLDEPEQRLDAGMRRRLSDRLRAEHEGGGAVLVASHDTHLVRTVATSVLVLSEAAVTHVGPDEGAAALDAL